MNNSTKSALKRCLTAAALPLLMAGAAPLAASCLQEAPLRGVNLAGAEFNSQRLPGIMHRNYTYPASSDLEYFAGRGANTIRLPVRWERLQHELSGELDAANLHEIGKVLTEARRLDLCLILDLHNYGRYHGELLGSEAVPVSAFTGFWLQLAEHFGNPEHLALGLMNEPFTLTIADWGQIAQQTVSGLREAGVEHLILVSGGRWSGVHEWFRSFSGASNADTFAGFEDPAGRLVLEVHQYLNEGYSGTRPECLPPEHFDGMFEAVSEWADTHGQRLFLGEFGAAATEECLASLDHVLEAVNEAGTWRGWAYWSAGSWWGHYFLSVHPVDGEDALQMTVLEAYFRNWSCEDIADGRCPEPPDDVSVNGG